MRGGSGLSAPRANRIHLAFLSLSGAELAVARVAERVRRGGHDVPADVVRRRYAAGLRNVFGRYRTLADGCELYDHSGVDGPRLIASGHAGGTLRVIDAASLRHLEGQAR